MEQMPTCSLGTTPCWSRWMPKGSSNPLGSPRWSRVLAGPVDLWRERSPHCSRFSGRTCDCIRNPHRSSLFLTDCTPWQGPTLEQFVKSCSLWEVLTLEKFVEDCLQWEGPHAGTGEECEESSPEEEEAAGATCDQLTASPISLSLYAAWGKEVE